MKSDKKIIAILALSCFIGVLFGADTYAKDYSTCVANANSKFSVNTPSSGKKIYNSIEEVSPGYTLDSAGVQWACANDNGTSKGVTWITDSNGYYWSGSNYVMNVNAYVKRSGNTTMGIVGSVNNKNMYQTVYATNVKICNSSHTSCNGDIGISYGSGWSNPYGADAYGYDGWDFLRASYYALSGVNNWTDPEGVAQIIVDGAKIINTVGIEEHDGYGVINLALYRGFNNGSQSYGWSSFKLLVEEAESTSSYQTNTRARVTAAGSSAREVKSGWAKTGGHDTYLTNEGHRLSTSNVSITFDNIMRGIITKRKSHTASIGWKGYDLTSSASGTISITPTSSSDYTYKPSSNWSSSFNSKSTGNLNLAPGQSVKKCSGASVPSTYSTISGASGTSSSNQCISVQRNYANYTGKITAKVTGTFQKSSANSNGGRNEFYTLANNSDGSYSVAFTGTITRSDRYDAGETYATQYKKDGGAETNTIALRNGRSQDVFTQNHGKKLKYGEKVTHCTTLTYRATQKTTGGFVNATNSKYCVTVERPNKVCDLNQGNVVNGKETTYQFGIHSGENLGRIGVRNNGNSYSYTPVNPNTQNSTIPVESDSNTWAKPGDKIVFNHQACAGAFYAIENKSLTGNKIGGGTHYGTEGSMKKAGIDPNNQSKQVSVFSNYLFGNDVTKIVVGKNGTRDVYYKSSAPYGRNPFYGSNPKPELTKITDAIANNAKTNPYANWTTGANGLAGDPLRPASGFLHDDSKAEMSKYSPSDNNGNSKTYTIRTEGQNDYINPSSGSETDKKILETDLGGTISQTLSWNHFKINNADAGTTNSNASDYKTYTATAAVRIPYNYVLQPYVNTEGGEDGIIYLGGSKKVKTGTGVIARVNKYVNSGQAYATMTKKTHVTITAVNTRNNAPVSISNTGGTKRFSRDGNPSGTASYDGKYGDIAVSVLDNDQNKVGDKICITIKVSPADSHNDPSATTVTGGRASESRISGVNNTDWALREDGTSERSATSCLTVAKRPTMSVESSNAYSAAGFTTSLYGKKFTKAGSEFLFGSWSEYGVFGKVNTSVDTFASGAALGHRTNKTSNDDYNATRPNDDADHVATSNNTSGSEPGKKCVFMSQTFANVNCDSSNTAIGGTSVETFKSRIEERYNIGKEYDGDDIASDVNVEPYVKENEPVAFRFGKDNTTIKGAPNIPANIVEQKSIGDNETKEIIKRYNHTIVYNAIGKNVTITGNITPTIKGADGNAIDSGSLHSLDDIVGVVILANNVNITSSVTRINAVIIAKTVNTCSGVVFNQVVHPTKSPRTDGDGLDYTKCNKTLIFDGPVITDKLILNRTAGAENGEKSIQRAEIFNLNMSNYLWSFNQMSRYSQAVTTYSRELPTRY